MKPGRKGGLRWANLRIFDRDFIFRRTKLWRLRVAAVNFLVATQAGRANFAFAQSDGKIRQMNHRSWLTSQNGFWALDVLGAQITGEGL